MLRRLVVSLSVVACFASVACQTYTKGLEQSLERAEEATTISTLRSIAAAQRAYSLSNNGDYGTFQQLTEGGYLDTQFNSSQPTLKGYVLTMSTTPRSAGAPEGSYSCNADPQGPASRSLRHFYIDSSSSVIHVNSSQPATASDESIQP